MPKTCEYYLYGKNPRCVTDMANDVITLRTFQEGVYPGLSTWALNNPMTSVLMRMWQDWWQQCDHGGKEWSAVATRS